MLKDRQPFMLLSNALTCASHSWFKVQGSQLQVQCSSYLIKTDNLLVEMIFIRKEIIPYFAF